MPFKSPVFKNSQPIACPEQSLAIVNDIPLNNQKEVNELKVMVPDSKQFTDVNISCVHTISNKNSTEINPAVFTSLENVADIPLEEAHQPQENDDKKVEIEIVLNKHGKENIPDINITATVKKHTKKVAKIPKNTSNKTIKSAKKNKMKEGDENTRDAARQAVKKTKTKNPKNGPIITFEQRDSPETLHQSSQQTLSQKSQQVAMSQPPRNFSQRERLIWLQERRVVGLWVKCDHHYCEKWRYLPHVHDPTTLPKLWYCHMNPDLRFNSCSVAEKRQTVAGEQDLIHGPYTAGSLVWARQLGYPWWPAMVDDCPDTEVFYWLDGFSDIPTYFNVVFFDSTEVTRSWLTPRQLQPFQSSKVLIKNDKYRNRILFAKQQANHALTLGIADRLRKYSFISRYSGPIISPKCINSIKRKIRFAEDVQKRSRKAHSSSDLYSIVQFSESSGSEDENNIVEFDVAASKPFKEKIITPTKSQEKYACKIVPHGVNETFEGTDSEISNRAVVCGDRFDSEIAPNSTNSKISNLAVLGDSEVSSTVEGQRHGARTQAILEEEELMGDCIAETDSTWHPTVTRTPYSTLENMSERTYEKLIVPRQRGNKAALDSIVDGDHDGSGSEDFDF